MEALEWELVQMNRISSPHIVRFLGIVTALKISFSYFVFQKTNKDKRSRAERARFWL